MPREVDDEIELYDLREDPHKTENVASNAAYADIRERHYGLLREKLERDRDPIVDGPIPPQPEFSDVTL